MRRPEFIARQSGNPSGLLGRLLGWIMARETAAQNDAALTTLALRPTDRVLEIGYGHGRTLERIAAAVPSGFVAGLDHSREMYETGSRHCAGLVETGRLELRVGDSRALPYPDANFDKVLAVHTLYFWRDPVAHLREVRRVLKPNGVLVLGFRPKEDPQARDFPEAVYTFYALEEVRSLLANSGFQSVEITAVAQSFALARAVRAAANDMNVTATDEP
jgi:ubiquinone/menaquinone biosynthesis C-methylase UbiE